MYIYTQYNYIKHTMENKYKNNQCTEPYTKKKLSKIK